MKVAICEDILAEAENLKTRIEELMPNFCLQDRIVIFLSGEKLLASDTYYDLLFIDCKLPDMTGIELAKKIREKNMSSAIIFVTSYMEFAAEGYTVNALRYLMKPVSDEKLREALSVYNKHIQNDQTIELTGMHVPMFVKTSEIMYIESLGRSTLVRLGNRSVNSTKSLEVFMNEIHNDSFFRTSRQFIVNMKYITRKEKDHLVMDNGELVIVSRRRLSDFNNRYMRYLKYTD